MISRTVLATLVVASLGSMAWAQDEHRVEISGSAGWTFSDGVSGGAEDSRGNEFARIDPKDAFSWNARIGYMVSPNVEIGALYGAQSTTLQISGASGAAGAFDFGDETLHNYHGYFAYNFGENEKMKPYILIGIGATQFGAVKVNFANIPVAVNANAEREIKGNTKFSSTLAAGLKLFPSPKIGIRLEGRWTPTYIKSDATGWWCDPYWGCYTVGDAQYANQFELSGGLIIRF